MKINSEKTQLLCMSSNNNLDIDAFIEHGGNKIFSGSLLKIVGFTFGARPNLDAHFFNMKRSFYARVWQIRHLKKAGIKSDKLVLLYKTLVRPVLDFVCVVYHSLLSVAQEAELERMQKHVLKIIGPNAVDSVEPLKERRLELIDKFIEKQRTNPRFFDRWFVPKLKNGYDTRRPEFFREDRPKTKRRQKNPLTFMRKRLNCAHAGKD